MQGRAKFLGHPVHQMLIVFPLGLLASAVMLDIAWLLTDRPWLTGLAFAAIVGGVVGGLVAAPFGTIDWLGIPQGTRARRVGAMHGLGNLAVTALFAASGGLRWSDGGAPSTLALLLSFGGGALSLLTAWLGGELVSRLGIGVWPDAHVDAPSSLSAGSRAPVATRRDSVQDRPR